MIAVGPGAGDGGNDRDNHGNHDDRGGNNSSGNGDGAGDGNGDGNDGSRRSSRSFPINQHRSPPYCLLSTSSDHSSTIFSCPTSTTTSSNFR